MIKRTMTGIVITLVVYFVIVFSYIPQVTLAVTAALSAAAVLEIFHATGKCRNKGLKYGCAIAAIILIFLPVPKYELLRCQSIRWSGYVRSEADRRREGFWILPAGTRRNSGPV